MYYSGNPGYDDSYPLLVDQGTDGTIARKVNLNGFKIVSSDENGKCIPSSSAGSFSSYLTLGFNEGLTVSCAQSYASLSEFQTGCSSADPNIVMFN